jgi:hypothetical protein
LMHGCDDESEVESSCILESGQREALA